MAKHSDIAREVQQLASAAGQATDRGIEAATLLIAHMDAILESARKVPDIVCVIDAIASQTNLLPTNAAIEAARAGEQGRGFAVVASEVRALSERCAGSAREISSVAQSAGAHAGDATGVVERMAEAIADINRGVAEVNRLMDGMAAEPAAPLAWAPAKRRA